MSDELKLLRQHAKKLPDGFHSEKLAQLYRNEISVEEYGREVYGATPKEMSQRIAELEAQLQELRDQFAMAALRGGDWIYQQQLGGGYRPEWPDDVADAAYKIADAMIRRRDELLKEAGDE